MIEILIYGCFLWMDITNSGNSMSLKYAGIILCLCFALYFAKDKNGYLITAALLFTAAADYFLLILNRHYIYGVLLFIPVQILYMARLLNVSRKHIIIEVILRIALPCLLFLALSAVPHPDNWKWLNLAVSIYFCNLFINGIKSFVCLGLHPFSIGLLLFICCDVSIGLRMMTLHGVLYYLFSVAIWAFYLPSQVLITLSVSTNDKGDFTHVIQN